MANLVLRVSDFNSSLAPGGGKMTDPGNEVALLSEIDPENLRHTLNQSDANLRPLTTWSLAFSRASEICLL